MTEIKTVEQFVVEKRLRPRMEAIAELLRDLATQVEQESARLSVDDVGANSDYAHRAGRVMQQIMNTLPNLGLDALAGYAAEADAARARGQVAEAIAEQGGRSA